MNTIGAAKFKERCLALLSNLDPDGLPDIGIPADEADGQ